ncbi:uncharacterized protein FTOL_07659 [Fusarium torulosum]|uniref:Uncharacterized protein n=1 Tax=Fusarium torulosum TaxID=33205 RepID=A0AAE8SJ89_9HYPO|nr:uncharacterized protein FTOL_07659 [Fusarium torulosum]
MSRRDILRNESDLVIVRVKYDAMVEVEDPLAIAHMLSMRHGYW